MRGKDIWRAALACVCVVVALAILFGPLGQAKARAADEGQKKAEGKPKGPKFAYVGTATCGMCHKSKKQGAQLAIWKKTKHAKAYETLKTDAAKKIAAEKGLKKPAVESPECLRCHVTGWDLTAEQKAKFLKKKFKIADGVQCETCHGPGEKYKKLSVMKKRELAVKNGLVVANEKLCRKCHNKESPTWNPEKYTTKDGKKVGFDYKTQLKMIQHPKPAAKKTE